MSFGEDLDKLVEEHSDGLVGKHPSWERVRLSAVAELVNGFAFKSSGFNEVEGTPLVRIRDILKGAPGTRYSAPVDDPKMKFIENGEIAIGMDGDFNSRIWQGGKALINQRVCTLKADEELYSQKLLAFALPAYLKLINDHTSSVTVKHLSSKTVQSIPLPLPPKAEQQRIVEKIETLFARLDKGEEAVREVQKLLTRYRQSVLKSAVTGHLTADWRAEHEGELEDGDELLSRLLVERRDNWTGRGKHKEAPVANIENLPELPKEWVWATLAQITNLKGGVTVDRKREPKDPVTLPYLRVANVQNGYLDLDEIKEITIDREKAEQCLLQDGDILLNEGGDLDKLGRGWVWRSQIDPCIHQNHVFRGRPILPDISSEFVSYYANAFGQGFFMDKGKQSVNLASISLTAISGLPIPLPPASEQVEIVKRISAKLRDVDGVRKWCQTELKRSASLRQSILKDAFAGRLVPQDPSDEPASALLARIKAAKDAPKTPRRKARA